MRKIVLTFGLISGAIMTVMMGANLAYVDRFGFEYGEISGYASIVAGFLMVFFGVKAYRDNVGGGAISFGRALSVGLLIVGLASVCYVATWEVIYSKMYPDFMDKYATHMMETARAGGETEAQLAQRQAEMARFAEMYKNPVINVAFTLMEPLPVGLVVALVTAGVLRRRKRGVETGVPVTV